MSGYENLLNQRFDAFPDPKPLPVGSWLLKLRNASYKPGNGEQNAKFIFVYQPKEPMDDVDDAQLAELGPDYDVSSNQLFKNFFVESASDVAAVRRHVAKHGVDVEGKTIEDALKAIKGAEIIGYLQQRTFTDRAGEVRTDNDIQSFVAVEQ